MDTRLEGNLNQHHHMLKIFPRDTKLPSINTEHKPQKEFIVSSSNLFGINSFFNEID